MTEKTYGKGSKPRPFTNMKSYLDNWDEIFGKGKKKSSEVKDKQKLNQNAPKSSAKPKAKGKFSICPHCATMNLKRLNPWTVKCRKCGWDG